MPPDEAKVLRTADFSLGFPARGNPCHWLLERNGLLASSLVAKRPILFSATFHGRSPFDHPTIRKPTLEFHLE